MSIKAKRIIAVGISIVLVVSILVILFLCGIIKINTPSTEQFPVRGVDVSEYQGTINWEVIEQQDIQFSFIKATEGSGYVDPCFFENWENVSATSIVHGAYHFFSFDSPAITQAENFIATVSKRSGMLPPVVDIELYSQHKSTHPDATAVRAELSLLLDLLETHYGKKPIIYATQQSYALYIAGHYSEYPLWIRDVFFTPSELEWTFWQYTDKEQLSGYDGPEKHIDMNVYCGNISELEQMCLQ